MSQYLYYIILAVIGIIIALLTIWWEKYTQSELYYSKLNSDRVKKLYSYEKPYVNSNNKLDYRIEWLPGFEDIEVYDISSRKSQMKEIESSQNLSYKLDLYNFIKFHHLLKLNIPKSPKDKVALEQQIQFLDEFIKRILEISPSLNQSVGRSISNNGFKDDIKDYFIHSLSFERFNWIVENKIPKRKVKEPYKIHLGKFIYFLSKEGFISINITHEDVKTEDQKRLMIQFFNFYKLTSKSNSGQQIYKAGEEITPEEEKQYQNWILI